jgi:hypothetical protein
MPGCDLCYRQDKSNVHAEFVLITGDIDRMAVNDWFICVAHADWICSRRNATRIILDGIIIDCWQLNAINDKAKAYHWKCLHGTDNPPSPYF